MNFHIMTKQRLLVSSIALATTLASQAQAAYELTPNPNFGLITVTTPDAQTHGQPFETSGQINIQSGGTLTNFMEFTILAGSVNIQSGGTLVNDAAEGVFVVDEIGTLSSIGHIDNFGRLKNSATFYNNATLTNHVNARLTNTKTMDQRGTLVNSGSFANAGGVFATRDAVLQNVGTWSNTAGSQWLNTGLTENFGIIDNAGTFLNQYGFNGGVSSAKISNRNTINNLAAGVMTNDYRWFNRSGSVLNNMGTFINSYRALGVSNESGASIVNHAGATFINQNSLNNAGTILNEGTFDFQVGSSNLLKDGQYTQTAGQTIVNGHVTTLVMDIQGGSLSGSGTIDADVMVGPAATLTPGNSPGTLSITGNLDLSGLLAIEIANDTLYDIVDVTGIANLGGTLDVSFFDTWRPATGDTFDILFADTINGQFDTLNLATLDPGLFWDVRYLIDTNGIDRVQLAVVSSVASVPLPASFWLFASGLIALRSHRKTGK